MTQQLATGLIGVVLIVVLSTPAMAGWDDWWQTPEQRAAKAFESGDYESLLQSAPDSEWSGFGQFQSGDYDAASDTFKQFAQQQREQGNNEAAARALYNQGVSDTLAGRYQQAIDNFDQVLTAEPENSDALHNRQLAEQLLELQQQEQQSQGGDQDQQGEQQQSGDNSDESGGEQSSEQQEQQSDSADQSGDDSQESSDTEPQGSEGDNAGGQDSQQDNDADGDMQNLSEEQRQQAADDAARALEAEARQQQDESAAEEDGDQRAADYAEQPLSESEQATEQLLRRIPDDPAGLLRRKLEQSHRSEYPEVRDAIEPW